MLLALIACAIGAVTVTTATATVTAAPAAAPRLSAHGRTLKWRVRGHHRLFKLSIKVGHRRSVTTVVGRSFTPPSVPGRRVLYRVRAARRRSPWSNAIAIAFPARPAPDGTASAVKPSTAEAVAQPSSSPLPEGETWRGYSAANPMPAGVVPYSSASPFNQIVPAHPAVLGDSGSLVSFLLGQGSTSPSSISTGGAYGHPIYYARSGDPVVEVHLTEPWGANPLSGRRIPVPAQAVPAPGSDGHMGIVLPNGEEVDLWQAQAPREGRLNASWGSTTSIAGSGLGGEATASRIDLFAGVIRAPELIAGVIPHALFAVSLNVGASFVYPAGRSDGTSTASYAPAEGQRFYLEYSDAEIAALALPSWQKAIVTALAHYGMYIGDSGGSGLGLQFESGVMYTAFGLNDPFAGFAQAQAVPLHNGTYWFDVASGVDWSRLRAIAPPP